MSINYLATVDPDLKLSSGASADDLMVVGGYNVVNDGGGGEFRFEGSAPSGTYLTTAATIIVTDPLIGGMVITGATDGSPISVNVVGHGLTTGWRVSIFGVTGTNKDDVNGTWTVTVVDADNFTLNHSTGGVFTNANTGTATSALITTGGAHGLNHGQPIMIGGAVYSGGGPTDSLINGTFSAISVMSNMTFSIAPGAPGARAIHHDFNTGFIGDGGFTIPGKGGRWLRQRSGVCNVRHFGARGNNGYPGIGATVGPRSVSPEVVDDLPAFNLAV